MERIGSCLLFAMLSLGCGGYHGLSPDEELSRVRQRAQLELECDTVEATVLDSYEATGVPRTVHARGCEQRATYLCVAGSSSCTWTMDSARAKAKTGD